MAELDKTQIGLAPSPLIEPEGQRLSDTINRVVSGATLAPLSYRAFYLPGSDDTRLAWPAAISQPLKDPDDFQPLVHIVGYLTNPFQAMLWITDATAEFGTASA